ncbi:Patatin-like phospholipase [Symmachiella macrocystis]|uniref:Patatin-like phospholipase n=1 Tax=Symmachiella macrocystis TaxID=2527985 RepID=A0A5C6BQ67_9PLAN|nr:patatin-like phospholipase family protein [Symmachiella macrocystis]TWU13366.1 Patatin-like phospholipase [Symmachiella macrocystis]
MDRLGLALSGGGFRGVLYHLGVVRFLRDAGILDKVTHITSVSGGSIIGAHLVLNWDKYCGSDEDFDQMADELVRYVQLDVRNRIVRRFPFASALNTLRRLLRMGSSRRLTRAGLLEKFYEKHLYGDTSLFQLPDRPRLHILSTNLSEGCLSSFHKDGLLLQRRVPGRRDRFESVHMGLATVPMAVAASSAFPGFFPPLEINGSEVGAEAGEFICQAFTDGGVYDNLGLRMFRCIEQSTVRETTPLNKADFLELDDVTAALISADNLPENTPLRRLRELLIAHDPKRLGCQEPRPENDIADALIEGLWEIIRSKALYRDSSFRNMELADASAQMLLNYVIESNRHPDMNDQLWLNRQIVEAALRQVIGKPCLRISRKKFDGIIVSDSSGKFKVNPNSRAEGLLRTTMRASDILMDRVWQLEGEAFENSPGVLFLPISDIVEKSQDRTAPHPEIQYHAARIRTDMDQFSDLEVRALVQHGYCVARKGCRRHSEIFKTDIPMQAPWDPIVAASNNGQPLDSVLPDLNDVNTATSLARELQGSSQRRVWSTLLSFRDWPSYIWGPLMVCLALYLPYSIYKMNQHARQQGVVLSALAQSSPIYGKVIELMDQGPAGPLPSVEYEVVTAIDDADYTGFEIISDSRIYDLRGWEEGTNEQGEVTAYTRLRIRRREENMHNTHVRLIYETNADTLRGTIQPQRISPKWKRMSLGKGRYRWELDMDFSRIPMDDDVELMLDFNLNQEVATQSNHSGKFFFSIPFRTGLSQVWVLMPEGRTYNSFEVSSFPIGRPDQVELVVPDSKVELPFGSIATFRLINPDADHRFECRWTWTESDE